MARRPREEGTARAVLATVLAPDSEAADPMRALALLNIEEESLRELLAERARELQAAPALPAVFFEDRYLPESRRPATDLEVAEAVERAVELLAAFREAYEATELRADDPEALVAAARRLGAAWSQVDRPYTHHIFLLGKGGAPYDGKHVELARWDMLRLIGERSLAWELLGREDGSWAWLDLWVPLKTCVPGRRTNAVLVCPVCRRIQQRGRVDQLYCSTQCKQRAAYLRRRGVSTD